jgi:hypothetical protein
MARRIIAGVRAYFLGRTRTRRTWMVAPIRKEVERFRSAWRLWQPSVFCVLWKE